MAIGLDPAAFGGWSNWSARTAASGAAAAVNGGAVVPEPSAPPAVSPAAAVAGAAAAGPAAGAQSPAESAIAKAQAEAKVAQARAAEGCQTCKERRYQDGSNDPGVSFKSPQKVSPEQAGSVVLSHEMEHVVRTQAKARDEGAEVVSQSVLLHTAICPECGRGYVSGGETRTVTAKRANQNQGSFDAGLEKEANNRVNGKA